MKAATFVLPLLDILNCL